jgi:hypothetical protein
VQEKIIGALVILAGVVLFNFVGNFWQEQQVRDSMKDILTPLNQHTFKNRTGLEDALFDAAFKIVGDSGDPAVELYFFQGQAYVGDIDMDTLPKYGGVKVVGDQVQMTALVGRIWWYQYTMWNKSWRNDVEVTKTVFVDPRYVGSMYERPPSAEFEFVDEPWRLLDSTK